MSGNVITYGQVAYEAYCGTTGWKSLVSGADLPPWDQLPDGIRAAWTAAGNAVSDLIHDDGAAEILDLRDRLAALRERLALLAANLEASAAASAPSKKSQIEQGAAAKVRALLAEDGQEDAGLTVPEDLRRIS